MELESSKGSIIAVAEFPHPDDKHLRVVCVRRPNDYVVWMWNVEHNEYFWGDYFSKIELKSDQQAKALALQRFAYRLSNSLDTYIRK
jgi:hypothetical protein